MNLMEQEAAANFRSAQHETNLQALRSHRVRTDLESRPGTLRRLGWWLADFFTTTAGSPVASHKVRRFSFKKRRSAGRA